MCAQLKNERLLQRRLHGMLIEGESQDEPVGQRRDKVKPATMEAKAFSFTHRTKVCAGSLMRKNNA